MLAADKLLLTSTIRKNATELKGKELTLHKTNFDAVGTQAAVLAGFAVGMLVEVQVPDEIHPALSGSFYISAVITLISNLRCVTMTTCITVMGTGLALRGPEGSMARAAEGMYKQRYAVFLTFAVGIISCLLSALFLCWIKMNREPAVICSLVLVWAIMSSGRLTKDYLNYFRFNEEETVTFDDILGSSAINNEALMRQLGVSGDQLLSMLNSVMPRASHADEHQV